MVEKTRAEREGRTGKAAAAAEQDRLAAASDGDADSDADEDEEEEDEEGELWVVMQKRRRACRWLLAGSS